ncbi:hypothetical protein AB0G73_24245 [Streptomyces sp. NPDC020719]|uniref:hypothetical protein n=1 Tax=Streptomyces sp. NPDC020719 TaxID=3154896 RepID=UPI0033FA05A3
METAFAHESELHRIITEDAGPPVLAVLHGGHSPDAAALSLHTAGAVADAATTCGFEAHLVDVHSDALLTLGDKLHACRAILTLADVPPDAGSLQGLLNYLDIKYVGAGVAGSSLTAHHLTARRVLRDVGVPLPAHGQVRAHLNAYDEALRITDEANAATIRSRPVTGAWDIRITPALPLDPRVFEDDITAWTGSAVSVDALSDLIARAAPFTPLMYESDIVGETLWVAVLDDAEAEPYTLPPRETGEPKAEQETLVRARDLALRAHRALHLRGVALHRFTRYRTTRLVWREVQTHPDLSPTGLLTEMVAAHHGWSYPDLIDDLLGSAITDALEAGGV